MTATQAPTPGPLTAGDVKLLPCPFCGGDGAIEKTTYGRPIMKWVKCRNCEAGATAYSTVSDAVSAWNARPSLAPTAPVEASGPEREHGPMFWGKTSVSDEMMYCYCGSPDARPHHS